MNPEELKARTRAFALRVIRLAESLPDTPTSRVIRNQMLWFIGWGQLPRGVQSKVDT